LFNDFALYTVYMAHDWQAAAGKLLSFQLVWKGQNMLVRMRLSTTDKARTLPGLV